MEIPITVKIRNNHVSQQESSFDYPAKVRQYFDNHFKDLKKCNSSFPPRQAIPTYLGTLDRQFRGGWSYQWPIVVAGPAGGGKSLLLHQFMASSLYSCPKPWRILYVDFQSRYDPMRVHKILSLRAPRFKRPDQLGRIDKITIDLNRLPNLLKELSLRRDLALCVIDDWNLLTESHPWEYWLVNFARIAQLKNMGFILSLRLPLEQLKERFLWDSIPYLLFIERKSHGLHRLRMWQNASHMKVYDRILEFKGMFREKRFRPA
ncbi:MAG: hypothetical protein ACTSPV_03860 [Candidatus Hodarchaeales archaeon]